MPISKDGYPILLRKLSPAEGGGYLAEFPDLPGCMADGDTPEEAFAEAQDALKSHLASMRKHGDRVPAKCFPEKVIQQHATASVTQIP
jgi:antitoxin HicB